MFLKRASLSSRSPGRQSGASLVRSQTPRPLRILCHHEPFSDPTVTSGFKPPNKAETIRRESPDSRITSSEGREKNTNLCTASCESRKQRKKQNRPPASAGPWEATKSQVTCSESPRNAVFPEPRRSAEVKGSVLKRTLSVLEVLISAASTVPPPRLGQGQHPGRSVACA